MIKEFREEVNSKLELWRQALTSKGFRLSMSKTIHISILARNERKMNFR